jgi:prepilin peptidase CpaA
VATAEASLVVWTSALTFTACAAALDIKTRRIPNWLTVSGVLTGIGLNAAWGGWPSLLVALEGAGLGLAILLPLVFLRALGAGDWKLIGAVGAFLGPVMLLSVLLASIIVAGAMATILMIRAGKVRETLRNLGLLVMGFFTFGLRANPVISLDNPDALRLPFGVAAALGTLICFVAAHWHLGI